jgi:hypothetical protein
LHLPSLLWSNPLAAFGDVSFRLGFLILIFLRTVRVRANSILLPALSLLFAAAPLCAQTPTKQPATPPAQKPTAKTPAGQPPQPAPADVVPSPVSKHYPILIVAHGNEPF